MENETCTKCGLNLPVTSFGARKGKNRKEGERHAQCKTCTAKHRKFRYNNEAGFASNASKLSKENYERTRLKAILKYGGECACCGETEVKFLSFDHINGRTDDCKRVNGYSGKRLLQWIVKNKYPDHIQLLCYNCNCAKGFHKECPHVKKSQDAEGNYQQTLQKILWNLEVS